MKTTHYETEEELDDAFDELMEAEMVKTDLIDDISRAEDRVKEAQERLDEEKEELADLEYRLREMNS